MHTRKTRAPRTRSKRPLSDEDIFSEILNEHRILKEQMGEVLAVWEKDPEKSGELAEECIRNIEAHGRAEERTLYAALIDGAPEDDDSLRDQILESQEEHHLPELIAPELESISLSDPRWKAKFTVLKEGVEHHIEEEERNIGKKWKKLLDADQRIELRISYLAYKSSLLGYASAVDIATTWMPGAI